MASGYYQYYRNLESASFTSADIVKRTLLSAQLYICCYSLRRVQIIPFTKQVLALQVGGYN